MKKGKVTVSKESIQKKKYPFHWKIVSMVLSVCLILVSLPAEFYGTKVQAEEVQKNVISFLELPEEIRQQDVDRGTELEALKLPKTLEAVCIAAVSQSSEHAEGQLEHVVREERTDVIENVTWESEPLYDGKAEGMYVFTPVLPEGYRLAEGIESPEIQVTVKNPDVPESEKQEQEEDPEPKENQKAESENQEQKEDNPKKRKAVESNPESEESLEGNLRDRDALEVLESEEPEESQVSPMAEIPKKIKPECGVITEDTAWGSGTLKDGVVTIPQGVTVTIVDRVDIEGKVTIQGEGRIERQIGTGGGHFLIKGELEINGSLTLDGMHGHCVADFIEVNTNGKLVLDGGCVIQNVEQHGEYASIAAAAVFIRNGGTGEFKDVTIKNCASGTYLGAIRNDGDLTIYGGVYEDNVTVARGGCIYNWGGSVTVHGGRFQNNRVIQGDESYGGMLYNKAGSVTIDGGEFIGNTAQAGGCICSDDTLVISGGDFNGNRAESDRAEILTQGGCIYSQNSLTITGGTFTGNTAREGGGVYSDNTTAFIAGGIFADNTAEWGGGIISQNNLTVEEAVFRNNKSSELGGAIYHDAVKGKIEMSGEVQFSGINHLADSSTDSVYLRQLNTMIYSKEKLMYPVKIYTHAYEGVPVIKGQGEYVIQAEDMKNVRVFHAVTKERWYNALSERNNTIYLTQKNPGIYHIFYDNNSAQGATVVDNEEYYTGEEATVKSGEGLAKEGFTFKEWNTQPDGSGEPSYPAGSKITVGEEDITLYAIFEEEPERTLTADFYSGEAGQKERRTVQLKKTDTTGKITTPRLLEMAEWNPVGWCADISSYEGNILPESDVFLTKNTDYYGVYQKDIVLSYDINGGENEPEQAKKSCYANVHDEITYQVPEFAIAPVPVRKGYLFAGWNTQPDGKGIEFQAGSLQKLEQSTILYAVWKEDVNAAVYQVEHYKQDVEGEGYTRADSDTEILRDSVGTKVTAEPKEYSGFTLHDSHPLGESEGVVKEDGSLVLKLYYDRNIYEIDFNLNGGYGKKPDTQKIRYGGLLKPVADPVRDGYQFKGWHLDEKGLDGGLWEFANPVENNTDILHTTLYAKWADELAPVMGEASFGTGHKNFQSWVLQKKSIAITVPVTEEGSGLAKAEYLLEAADGTKKEGTAQIAKSQSKSDGALAYGSGASVVRVIQTEAEQGLYTAKILIEEEFKGKVYLTCTDHAGNVSAQKILTAAGGGIIIEDNAPEISFSNTEEKTKSEPVNVKVTVKDKKEKNVTGGIAGITYRVDKETEVALPEKDFNQKMVESYEFTVKVLGEGKHTLLVTAKDHAGNESEGQVTLKISGEEKVPDNPDNPDSPDNPNSPENPDSPDNPNSSDNPDNPSSSDSPNSPIRPIRGGEPKTGDSIRIGIYATVSMIAGFTYLLLYFQEDHGLTEQKKEEIVYRLVEWAKKGGTLRRILGIAVISLFLAYYHSIGKSVSVELKEMYVKRE